MGKGRSEATAAESSGRSPWLARSGPLEPPKELWIRKLRFQIHFQWNRARPITATRIESKPIDIAPTLHPNGDHTAGHHDVAERMEIWWNQRGIFRIRSNRSNQKSLRKIPNQEGEAGEIEFGMIAMIVAAVLNLEIVPMLVSTRNDQPMEDALELRRMLEEVAILVVLKHETRPGCQDLAGVIRTVMLRRPVTYMARHVVLKGAIRGVAHDIAVPTGTGMRTDRLEVKEAGDLESSELQKSG
jgi:hypothetical protein